VPKEWCPNISFSELPCTYSRAHYFGHHQNVLPDFILGHTVSGTTKKHFRAHCFGHHILGHHYRGHFRAPLNSWAPPFSGTTTLGHHHSRAPPSVINPLTDPSSTLSPPPSKIMSHHTLSIPHQKPYNCVLPPRSHPPFCCVLHTLRRPPNFSNQSPFLPPPHLHYPLSNCHHTSQFLFTFMTTSALPSRPASSAIIRHICISALTSFTI
jgi:hypothetical protein